MIAVEQVALQVMKPASRLQRVLDRAITWVSRFSTSPQFSPIDGR
jgi:hypothetical protein